MSKLSISSKEQIHPLNFNPFLLYPEIKSTKKINTNIKKTFMEEFSDLKKSLEKEQNTRTSLDCICNDNINCQLPSDNWDFADSDLTNSTKYIRRDTMTSLDDECCIIDLKKLQNVRKSTMME